MKYLVFSLVFFQLLSCIPHQIYKDFDEFENARKFKLIQVYNAKRDFIGSEQIKIKYYKTIDSNGKINISAQLLTYSNSEDGKLMDELHIRIGNEVYDVNFYNYLSNYDLFRDAGIDYDEENSNINHNEDENIRHLADFDIPNEIVEKIMNNNLLSMRFYIGKEAYTVRFSKFELKQLKKFLIIQ